jgi:GT2 family glycosyltransferase
MSGVIGVSTAGNTRFRGFYESLTGLRTPEGWFIIHAPGDSSSKNRNKIIEKALELKVDHILFLDDDHVFAPQTLNKLLAHDKDIVVGPYLYRSAPFNFVLFDLAQEDGRCRHKFPTKEDSGLVEVVAAGGGCLLVKTSIFQKLQGPYYFTIGEIVPDEWSDDIMFYKRVRDAGLKIYADLDTPVGHKIEAALWPTRDADGNWNLTMEVNGTPIVFSWNSTQNR